MDPIPEDYLCPITHEIMWDPVVTSAGHAYSRDAIEQWLETHDTDPVTNTTIKKKVYPCIPLRKAIREYAFGREEYKIKLREYNYVKAGDVCFVPDRIIELYPWERNNTDTLLDPKHPENKHVVWLRGKYDPESPFGGLRYSGEPTDMFTITQHPNTYDRIQLLGFDIHGKRRALGLYVKFVKEIFNPRGSYAKLVADQAIFEQPKSNTVFGVFRLEDDGTWSHSPDPEKWKMGDVVTIELFHPRP